MLVEVLSSRSFRRELRDFYCLSVPSRTTKCVSYLSKARLVSEIEESTNAVLTRLKVEILHKAESTASQENHEATRSYLPLAKTSVQVHDCLAAVNLAKASSIREEHVISGLGKETSDVDVSDTLTVFKTLGQSQVRWIGPHCRHGSRNGGILLGQSLHVLQNVTAGGLHHLKRQTRLSHLGAHIERKSRDNRVIQVGNDWVLEVFRLVSRSIGRRSNRFVLVGGTPVVPLVTHRVLHVVIHHEWPSVWLDWTRDHGVHVWIKVRREIRDLRLVGSRKRAWGKRADLGKAIEHGSIGKNKKLAIVWRTRRSGKVKVRSHGDVSLDGIELGS